MKCIDEEVPFEIPASWEWSRLGSIIDFGKSNSVKPDTISNDTWVLDLEDIEKDTGKLLTKKRKSDIGAKSDKHIFFKGNVLYSKLRPYLNKVIIADENGVCTSEILPFDFEPILNKYAQIFLMSPFFVDYAMCDAYGVKMPRLGSKQGNNALMPVPPISEQNRIVLRIDSLTLKIHAYGQAQSKLDLLSISIKERLRKSIIQEAIQGKLVPQGQNDEPASVLLERIRAEKERLIKEKKIKCDKNESVIYKGDDNSYYEKLTDGTEKCIDDEIPFKLPKSWSWCRLGSICQLIIGKTPPRGDSSIWCDVIYPWVSISDMTEYGYISSTKEKVSQKAAEKYFGGRISQKESLLMSFKLTIGRTSILKIDAFHNEAIITVKPILDDNYSLRNYLFRTLPLLSNLGDSKDAIKGKTLNSQSLSNLLIPISSSTELYKICQIIDKVLETL